MDELDQLEHEMDDEDALRAYIKHVIQLIRKSDMPLVYEKACVKFLRSCKREVCKVHKVKGSNGEFMAHHLQREMEKFAAWVITFIPTQKMGVPQEPLVLRHFQYDAATAKTIAMNKLVM